MKTESLLYLAALLLSSVYLQAAGLGGPGPDSANVPSAPDYSVVERGPHHRVIRGTSVETNTFDNRTIIRTNSFTYTELETGMHRKDPKGEFVETSDGIALAPGGALTTNSAHEVFFAANANSAAALRVKLPDEKTTLKSHVLWLTYFDRETGSNAIVAELTDSIGQIISANEVLYTNALVGDCVADILYHNSKAGIEQNIILRTQPPDPSEYGIANASLQVWSEFVGGPKPKRFASHAHSGLDDEVLDFGAMKIGPGQAFGIEGKAEGHVPVQKQWVELEGRTFLVEQVPVDAVTAQLQDLPESSTGGGGSRGAHGSIQRRLPKVRFAEGSTNAMQVAQVAAKEKPGFLLDYDMANATNFIFQADTTYYLSGSVVIVGSNIFEGGCVLKYATNASLNVWPTTMSATIYFFGSAYRPITFTAKDDQSIGATISGSASSPSGYYANSVLFLAGISQTPAIAHVRIAYAKQAIGTSGVSADISDAQFVNCSLPFYLVGSTVHMRNVLMANCQTNFSLISGVTISAENVTFSGCNYLAIGSSSPGGCTLGLTNCILADVTNFTAGLLTVSADTNGFWNSATVGNVVTNTTYPFQTAGAATFYLAGGCKFLNAGTTLINSDLLSALKTKTTYPPVVISNTVISTDTVLSPQALRDTDVPDLGYHYDPLDYAFHVVQVTNATLQIQPGTAIATAGYSAGTYGLATKAGGKVICKGTADNLVKIVRYNMVQEVGNTNWNPICRSVLANGWTDTPAPELRFSFTDWSMPAQDANQFESFYNPSTFSFANCQFHGGKFYVLVPNLYLTNCLFERVNTTIDDFNVGADVSPIVRNCLFFYGALNLTHYNADTWSFRDNAFDFAAITQDGDVDGAYDGYKTGSNRLTPTNAHDVVTTTVVWQKSFLGSYYQPTNSGFINKGSTTASSVGLYHFTVTTNLVSNLQIKETNSVVDIGFHYVAVSSSGKPIDTDGDNIADYFEDSNGDGSLTSGETDWQTSENSTTGTPGLQVFTVLE